MSEQALLEARDFNHTGYHQYLAERRLMAARCTYCGEIHLPPRPLCPRCYRAELEWVELSGEGRLEGFTFIFVGLPAMTAQGYSREKPYCSGVVRLKEGPVITAQILVKEAPTDGIEVGDPVRVIFPEREGSDQVALAFEVMA